MLGVELHNEFIDHLDDLLKPLLATIQVHLKEIITRIRTFDLASRMQHCWK